MEKKIPLVTLIMLLRDFPDNKSIEKDIRSFINKTSVEILSEFDASILYEIVSKVEGVSISKIADSMIATKDLEYIYRLAILDGELVDQLAQAVIELNDAEYMFKFLITFNNGPKEELKEALYNINDPEYIYKLTQLEIMDELDEEANDCEYKINKIKKIRR